jgi:hypothetical protein
MKMIIIIIFLFTSLNNCGFKIAENKELKGYLISKIDTYGESRINYRIKNMLNTKSEVNSQRKLKITLNTKKEKKVKEKNINNEITKYQMNVTTNVVFEDISQKLSSNFTINVSGEYRVLENHIQTINNEKKLRKNLANEITDKIITELSDKLNDL